MLPRMRILAAMSGGVDSSVAAAQLVRDGHEVVGAYMKNWINEENITGHCPWEEDIDDARAVAEHLGIEFRVVNLMQDYRERVVNYLLAGYQSGVTPNPDVMCNREMKFGVFLEYARDEGFEAVAVQRARPAFSHLATAGVSGAEKEDAGLSKIVHDLKVWSRPDGRSSGKRWFWFVPATKSGYTPVQCHG